MLSATIKWKQYNKSGILIPELSFEHKANTFLKQYIQCLCAHFGLLSLTTLVRDTGNTLRTVAYNNSPTFDITANSGDVTHGIVLGTGTTVVISTDYVLETPIAHGTGAGQLSYSAMGCDTDAQLGAGTKAYFTIFRTVQNNSGGDITAKEAAIYIKNGSSSFYFCIDRTLTDYAILNGNSAVITYEINNQ